jgi:hypothetical protein
MQDKMSQNSEKLSPCAAAPNPVIGLVPSPESVLGGSPIASVAWPWPEAAWIFSSSLDAAPAPQASSASDKPGYYDFVRDFPAESWGRGSCQIDIAAFSHYQLWVDGRFIGRGPAVGYQNLAFFDRWELPELPEGREHVRVAVRLFHEGVGIKTAQEFDYGLPGLLLAIHRGEQLIGQSDVTWLCRSAPEYGAPVAQLSFWGSFKESWHADRVDAWRQAGDSLAGWGEATALETAGNSGRVRALRLRETPVLTARPICASRLVSLAPQLGGIELKGELCGGLTQPVELGASTESVAPLRVLPGAPLAAPELTWDFGWVKTGHCQIELEGGGAVVELHYGESLDTLRCDVLHCTAGCTQWESFHRRSFRFLKLRFIALDAPVTIRRVGLLETRYPFPEDVHSRTGDRFADASFEVSRRTLASTTSHHYEDCPWREQALWIVDARILALANTYLCGDQRVTAKSLRQLFALQRPSGAVSATGPKDNAFYFLDFMLHLVPMLMTHYHTTGDRQLLADLRGPVEALCRFVDSLRDPRGLLNAEGAAEQQVGIFFDWCRTLHRKGCTTILNALYARHLDRLAEFQELFEQADEAATARDWAAQVRRSAREVFYDAEAGLYRDACPDSGGAGAFSMQANIAAIFADFETGAAAEALLDQADRVHALPRPQGPAFYFFVFRAMHQLGRHAQILQWMRDYWGGMLERGATTWWEVFEPGLPANRYPHPFLGQTPTYEREEVPVSLCHGWSCVPAFAIPRYLFGIDLGRVGSAGKVYWEAATPALFDGFDYRVHTVHGPLHLRLTREGERYALEVVESAIPVETIPER